MYIPKISVIVPIYNAGSYLRKTLDSIVNQTLKEIEIILVLDCPTDGSDIVAHEYAQQDDRIILVRNDRNLHIGLSRNEGLKVAKGKYVSFFDHDDYAEPDMLKDHYNKAIEELADVVLSDFKGGLDDTFHYFGFPQDGSDKEFQAKSFSYLVAGPLYICNTRSITSNGQIWNHIYKTDFLRQNNIWFGDNRKITFEDRIFLIHVYYAAKKIARIDRAYYHHLHINQ